MIIGFQLHHSTYLEDALRGLANASAGLNAAAKKTLDPEYLLLLDELASLQGRVTEARNAAHGRMMALHRSDPGRFQRCRDGEEPWPDEVEARFVARCSCQDQCLRHDHGVDEPEVVCACGVPCPRHGDGSP